MAVKISDLTLPKEKLENEHQVVQVSLWQEGGEALGWAYGRVLPRLRFGKISVRVRSKAPVITREALDEKGMAIVRFDNLMITPWGHVNGRFISYGLTATAYKATLVPNK